MALEADAIRYLHKNYVAWLQQGQWEPALCLPPGSYPLTGEWMLITWQLEVPQPQAKWAAAEELVESCMTAAFEAWVVCRGEQVTALVMANSLSTWEVQAHLWIAATAATEALQRMHGTTVRCCLSETCGEYAALPSALQQELSAWWTARCCLTPQARREHRKRIQNYLKKGQYSHIAGYVSRNVLAEGTPPEAFWHWIPLIMESLWMQHRPSMTFLTKELSMEALRTGGAEQLVAWTKRIASQLKATAKPQDPIARVMLSIQKDCSLPYSQSNLAEGLGLSPAYFSRLFEKRAGVRFSTYLTSARIAHAQELLRHGATLAEVTQACGYQRKSYFCEVFRKQTGMTALTYRAMLRKDDRR